MSKLHNALGLWLDPARRASGFPQGLCRTNSNVLYKMKKVTRNLSRTATTKRVLSSKGKKENILDKPCVGGAQFIFPCSALSTHTHTAHTTHFLHSNLLDSISISVYIRLFAKTLHKSLWQPETMLAGLQIFHRTGFGYMLARGYVNACSIQSHCE